MYVSSTLHMYICSKIGYVLLCFLSRFLLYFFFAWYYSCDLGTEETYGAEEGTCAFKVFSNTLLLLCKILVTLFFGEFNIVTLLDMDFKKNFLQSVSYHSSKLFIILQYCNVLNAWENNHLQSIVMPFSECVMTDNIEYYIMIIDISPKPALFILNTDWIWICTPFACS